MVAWTTEYDVLAVKSMRAAGRCVDDEVLAHVSPAHSEYINFFGFTDVDIDAVLAQLGPTGYRPLRVRDTRFCQLLDAVERASEGSPTETVQLWDSSAC